MVGSKIYRVPFKGWGEVMQKVLTTLWIMAHITTVVIAMDWLILKTHYWIYSSIILGSLVFTHSLIKTIGEYIGYEGLLSYRFGKSNDSDSNNNSNTGHNQTTTSDESPP